MLNHPVDCGICDKAGECRLQDYEFEYGLPRSRSLEREASQAQAPRPEPAHPARQRALHPLQPLRAFHARGLEVQHARHRRARRTRFRGARDRESVRRSLFGQRHRPVSRPARCCRRDFLYKSRCWFLEPVRSVCTGCARGCSIDVWRRKKEWQHALARRGAQQHGVPRHRLCEPRNQRPWLCNKGFDQHKVMAQGTVVERPARRRAASVEQAVERAQNTARRGASTGRPGLGARLERGARRLCHG